MLPAVSFLSLVRAEASLSRLSLSALSNMLELSTLDCRVRPCSQVRNIVRD